MKIELIDFGYEIAPKRAHYNDAGADVFAKEDAYIPPYSTRKIPLGFGLKIPDGYCAFVCPRSGLSSKGITTELAPIDSGYRGEIHAIVTNNNVDDFCFKKGDKIGQLVILPVAICEFVEDLGKTRGNKGFGSTGN